MPKFRRTSGGNTPKGRRRFLKSVTLGAGGLALTTPEELSAQVSGNKTSAAERLPVSRTTIEFPRIFSQGELSRIAFPLGGIGTGSISLGGRGQLRDFEIF